MYDIFNNSNIITLLNQTNNQESLFILLVGGMIFMIILSTLLMFILPKKYHTYRGEIFTFIIVINIGLLFTGIVLTLIMLLIGLTWATHKVNHPSYESIDLENEVADFPIVSSQFYEGILTISSQNDKPISTEDKIKSLKILYESNTQGNIGKIKPFLADNSDETRLYAFALISSFEKKLNNKVNEIKKQIENTENNNIKALEQYKFELAQTYWDFIFYGVANEQLTHFYTQKSEATLKDVQHNADAFKLLGKIQIYNKAFNKAEAYFLKSIQLGTPKSDVYTFLAEIKYEQRKYNEVSEYILIREFSLDLKLKHLTQMWEKA